MEATKSEFLASLDAELEAAGKPPSVPATAPSKRGPRVGRYLVAAIFAMAGPLVVFSPSPAAAATCYSPNFVSHTHTKACSNPYSYVTHRYLRTSYVGMSTKCYHFYSTAHNVCGNGESYPIGETMACKTY